METDAQTVGSEIVRIQREARFADTSVEEWGERLAQFIGAQPDVLGQVRVSDVRQVGTAAGGSNGTLLFHAAWTTAAGTQTRDLVLRFLPMKGLFHAYDVAGQFNLQRALEGTDVPAPPQLWLDQDGQYLTRPGYVMGQMRGAGPPMAWMTSGIIAEATPDARRAMTTSYVHTLAKLHALDWRALGLQWLENRASGARPHEREINWYWDALAWTGARDYVDQLAPVRAWLIANEPTDVAPVVCHGDANLGNYLFDDAQVSAVVDWEMAFLGAPECDLSFLAIGNDILQGDVAPLDGALTYEQMKAEYERVTGRPLRHIAYFELFTAFRVAVINVLAMQHFPPEILQNFMPVLERGPRACLDRARALGVSA